jgi:hypothetical protein
MAELTFRIRIEGFWRVQDRLSIPPDPGILFVYETSRLDDTDSIFIDRLIYIDESEDLRTETINHELYRDWLRFIREGYELSFSIGRIMHQHRMRIKRAYIHRHRPPMNHDLANSFPFDSTTIISTGMHALLSPHFTVHRTPDAENGKWKKIL